MSQTVFILYDGRAHQDIDRATAFATAHNRKEVRQINREAPELARLGLWVEYEKHTDGSLVQVGERPELSAW